MRQNQRRYNKFMLVSSLFCCLGFYVTLVSANNVSVRVESFVAVTGLNNAIPISQSIENDDGQVDTQAQVIEHFSAYSNDHTLPNITLGMITKPSPSVNDGNPYLLSQNGQHKLYYHIALTGCGLSAKSETYSTQSFVSIPNATAKDCQNQEGTLAIQFLPNQTLHNGYYEGSIQFLVDQLA